MPAPLTPAPLELTLASSARFQCPAPLDCPLECSILTGLTSFAQGGAGLYVSSGTVVAISCTLSHQRGEAVYLTGTASAALHNCTFTVEPNPDDATAVLIFAGGVPIDYGNCTPGWTPGNVVNVLVGDGNFTGCPFRCSPGTFGPGGESEVLRELEPGCGTGCKTCPPGTVCDALALPAPINCTAGHYCLGGQSPPIPCGIGTFSLSRNASDVASCISCDEHFGMNNMVTQKPGAVSAKECVCGIGFCDASGSDEERSCIFADEGMTSSDQSCKCKPGYYDNEPAMDQVACKACTAGFSCPTIGVTLATLEVQVGWYRTSNKSVDLRRCPDGSKENSGCIGGIGDRGPCKRCATFPHKGPKHHVEKALFVTCFSAARAAGG